MANLVSKSKGCVKVYLSSRPDSLVEYKLRSTPSVDISIMAEDNERDIESFLNVELDRLSDRGPSSIFSKLRRQIIERLLGQCKGMFQWASLQIKQVSRCRVKSDIEEKLDNLPGSLEQAYEEAWKNIENAETTHRLFAERAILWVMAATRPFTTEQLLAAVRINPSGEEFLAEDEVDEGTLLMFCNDLLAIDTQQNVWRFSHLSVCEFLEKRNGWYPPQAHFHAASACLNLFINFPWTEQSDLDWYEAYYEVANPQMGLKTGNRLEVDQSRHPRDTEIKDYRNWFNIYSRHHMFEHVRRAHDDEAASLASLLKTFLGSPEESSEKYAKWYNLLSSSFLLLNPEDYYVAGCDEAGLDTLDLNQSGLSWIFNSEIGPATCAIFAMCHFSLNKLLLDWWEDPEVRIDLTKCNERGHNLLTIAARAGCTDICRHLVNRGFDVSAVNNVNWVRKQKGGDIYGSALEAAAHQGHLDTVRYILSVNAKVTMEVSGGHHANALTAAAAAPGDNVKVVELLLARLAETGVDINSPIHQGRHGSALASASAFGNMGVVECLLKAGADVNPSVNWQTESSYASPLGFASITGSVDIAERLLDAGADPNSAEPFFGANATPIGAASYAAHDLGHKSCVQLLVSRGANPELEAPGANSIRERMPQVSPGKGSKILQGGQKSLGMSGLPMPPRRWPPRDENVKLSLT